MATISRFEEIEAWQTARQLTNALYDLTEGDGFATDPMLREQLRRAAFSVMFRIAEGFESRTQELFIEFLGQAKAAAGEVRAQLYLALDRGYLTQEQFALAFELAEKASRQAYRFMLFLETHPDTRRTRADHAEYSF